LGQPWKTQKLVRQIMDELYTPNPDGLCGNEDCGQMSAWYVLSAMGFYPVAPGSNQYAIGTPIFKKVTLNLENGKQFIIKADKPSKKNIYIQSAALNGADYTKSFLSHADIQNGGELSFKMGRKPNMKWGTGVGNEPVSAITDHLIVPVPAVLQGHRVFRGSDTIVLNHPQNADIYYTLDGAKPTETSTKYTGAFVVQQNTVLKAIAVKDGKASMETESELTRVRDGWRVTLNQEPHRQYMANGEFALIDGIKGLPNFGVGTWQGFYGKDLAITLDLGKVQPVNEVSIGFLQASYSWIFFPPLIMFSTSTDGMTFRKAGFVRNTIEPNQEGTLIHYFKQRIGHSARYIHIVAKSFGPCPGWHPGAGSATFLFADEIEISE
jgi:hypothetical protein